MTLRRLFLLMIAPLFVLLAGVNGVFLYLWDGAEARRQLQSEAVAAALTAAAFTDVVDDLGETLADPRRSAMLTAAAGQIEGLRALYVVRPDGFRWIAGRAQPNLKRHARPQAATALPLSLDAEGRYVITALAPATNGRVVVAQIDAEPLRARAAALRRLLTALVAGAGVLGLVLAWLAARSIAGEVMRAHRLVAAEGLEPEGEARAFRLRETRDLAAAVRLMRASVAGRIARGRHDLARLDQARDETAAVVAWRDEAMPPLSTATAGVEIAIRRLGVAPPGSFWALCAEDGRTALALGECEGASPSDALARAVAAQRFLERRLLEGKAEDRLDEAARAFAIARLSWVDWSEGGSPETGLLALLDADAADCAAAYGRRAENLAPDAVIDDLAALLDANGVVAVLRPWRAVT